jgi:hypothetical protein
MDIWDADKLLVFLAFVIPGFITIKTYELLFPGIQQDSSKQIVDAVAYSCINYALLIWPIIVVETSEWKDKYPNARGAFYVFVLLVCPVLLSVAWWKIRSSKWFQRVAAHPTQSPWDYVFSKRQPYWIKVVLKDGRQIGGRYDTNSFSSSAPAKEQIYLEESWIMNEKGGFERPKNKTAGVIVTSNEIAYIELLELRDSEPEQVGESDERKKTIA